MHLTPGDFNLNLIDYENCKKSTRFFKSSISKWYDSRAINKPATITRKITTAIDHILTSTFVDRTFKSGIYKTDTSDHFQVMMDYTRNKIIFEM